ncbi:ubiquitin carboxyl-terminal hydrolase calypso-like isoform X1 [Biomphalaria glabrata]|uniref:Ubiquitin carboxyl-terminal hydrolase n=1 Tax=Biomphalaria glabrata TaxID=6526 RepID=A0A9U8EBA6_BIOGL|nr:ubiquitin carboxyl-terminal hydrolase calypso-like isoform X1 [Biomphalaria glabrata]XP_013080580.2 ubiquitin carboxyl-terminal hydrolase calypso-like isoform X1 [Biomphalaria glabrata]
MNKGWLELESDPGLFTLLLEDFGVNGVQVEEIYDLQKPIEGPVFGFIFLFRWIEERRSRRKTNTEVESFVTDTEAVNQIFFAQQIIPNSCATHALLSVLLNCDNKVKLGKTLNLIKEFTNSMSPEDKGYAIANMPELARVHNSFARPENSKPLPEKQAGLSSVRAMDSETFHFVSYVPIHGHLFELDGLKPHPIDHGPWEKGEEWTEKFRRVITDRLGMATGGEPYHDIRFNLMTVVPDKRQLLEQKLTTLRTNRKIVLEALQQLLDAKVVSPASCDRSDTESKPHASEGKKTVTFSSAPPVVVSVEESPSASQLVVQTNNSTTETSASSTTFVTSLCPQPSISKSETVLSTSAAVSLGNASNNVNTSMINSCVNGSAHCSDAMKLRSSSSSDKQCQMATGQNDKKLDDFQVVKEEKGSPSQSNLLQTETGHIKVADETQTKQEPMDATENTELATKTEAKPNTVKTELTAVSDTKVSASAGGGLKSDITKPLSIETKFSTSPCAASNESTDTASEIGSGFSSPGSLNTSSCQSSPQFLEGGVASETKVDSEESHSLRKKRKSNHVFTPKDLLDLLKNVEKEIEHCESSLKEENEKRKKYQIDACRRTHNYDTFIMTFLSMLAEQGVLGDLMEENMAIKRPGPKMTKKSLLKESEKKKRAKIKKKGKK